MLGGTAMLVLAILFLTINIYIELFKVYPENDGPILWDQVALRVVPAVVVGIFMVTLGIRNFRRRTVLK